jgi:hypothetical protein
MRSGRKAVMLPSTWPAAGLLALLCGPTLACPDWQDKTWYGDATLSAGFEPTPFWAGIKGGGTVSLRDCGFEWEGAVDPRPDLRLHWDGEAPRLAIYVEAEEDLILLVRDPEGHWLYDDNGWGRNPLIVITGPTPGDYVIFIGSRNMAEHIPVRLLISETGP